MKIQPTSLQQRTILFVLLPTFLLLLGTSFFGYIYVRDLLLSQWGDVAVSRLQRTAHQIDMRLMRPKELLLLLQNGPDSSVNRLLFDNIINQIRAIEEVVDINVVWPEQNQAEGVALAEMPLAMMGRINNYHFDQFDVGPPVYNKKLDNRTVSLVSEFTNGESSSKGRIEIIISFYSLIDQVINAPWWKSIKAYLIGGSGNVLINTSLQFDLEDYFPMRAFGTVSTLEKDTLEAMKTKSSGTVFGPGLPPDEISGFCRLEQAPWTMVVIAPGNEVLAPIIKFRNVYIGAITVCIIAILLFIRGSVYGITTRIEAVSAAADDLAKGNFGSPLVIQSRDEVGELARSFNTMSRQLRQRLEMQKAIDLAGEIQQNLLPQKSFEGKGLVVSGKSIYCDETGGDFYDILHYPGSDHKVGIAVGDVVGHGIGAALLMTTVRALLRCRISKSGSLGEIIGDVNELLCRDTIVTGNFVTLFYMVVDVESGVASWVRGGHEPAIVYSPMTGTFSELKGKGVALGVDAGVKYEYNEISLPSEEQLILIGSDGAWEIENVDGEQFGKDRLKQIVAASSDAHPEKILEIIVSEIASFRGAAAQCDDITLAVIKTG